VLCRPQQRCPFAAVGFRLLLLVSLWQGPIIWGHDHAVTDLHLAEHVARFHVSESDSWKLGWHWHFSIPESRQPTSPEDTGRHQEPLKVMPVCGYAASLSGIGASGSNHAVPLLLLLPLSPTAMRPSIVPHDSCLHRFRSSRLTQLLLCRMSC
jgi:hypothetical protein